jgi:hypothetical protein
VSLVVSVPYGHEDPDCLPSPLHVFCSVSNCLWRDELKVVGDLLLCPRHRGEAGRPKAVHGRGLWPLPRVP